MCWEKMKKRIFIAIHYLEIGGAERSLIGLMNALDYTKYSVDLFVYQHRGEFMNLIPKQVDLLPENGSYAAIEKPMKEALREGHVGVVTARLLAKIQYKAYKSKYHPKEGSAIFQYVADCVTPILPSLKKYGEYDLAISFLTPHNIVRDKVRAKKKLAWIHTDYSTIDVNVSKELPVWAAYDKIFAVSEGVKENFINTFPSLSDKVGVFENILSETFIREQANMGLEQARLEFRDKNKGNTIQNPQCSIVNLLSVGRFTSAKNFDNVSDICKRIINKLSMLNYRANRMKSQASLNSAEVPPIITEGNVQFKVRWFLIGFGGEETLIRKNIEEAGMQDYCIILGKKENPYPYMATCDIYVQPSRFEGKAVTVREAQILCKPVIIANYKTAHSQVKDGIDGIIVPQSNEEMADAIVAFLLDKQKQQEIVTYLQTHHYGNEDEVKKLDSLDSMS